MRHKLYKNMEILQGVVGILLTFKNHEDKVEIWKKQGLKKLK